MRGKTNLGHPVATSAGLAVVQENLKNNLISQVQIRGRTLETVLRSQLGQHPHVGDIRGRGLFWGVEIVADRDTKTPFDPSLGTAKKLKAAAFERGLICYPMPGTRDGKIGDHVLLAPPFISAEQDLKEAVSRLQSALDNVLR